MKRHQFSIAEIMRLSLLVCLFCAWLGPPRFFSSENQTQFSFGPRASKWTVVFALGFDQRHDGDKEAALYIWHLGSSHPNALIWRYDIAYFQWGDGIRTRLL